MTNTLLAVDRLLSPLVIQHSAHCSNRVFETYGQRSPQTAMPYTGFTGQQREKDSGFYLLGNGHRAYNPVLKRFLSADRLSPFGLGGLNSYAYCQGDPINLHDRNGRSIWGNIWSFVTQHFPPFVNVYGASQGFISYEAISASDRRYNTRTIDPESLTVQGTRWGSLGAAVGAALEYWFPGANMVTSTGNTITISSGYIENAQQIQRNRTTSQRRQAALEMALSHSGRSPTNSGGASTTIDIGSNGLLPSSNSSSRHAGARLGNTFFGSPDPTQEHIYLDLIADQHDEIQRLRSLLPHQQLVESLLDDETRLGVVTRPIRQS